MTDAEKHPLIAGINWILENRPGVGGRKLSRRELSKRAGLSYGHVEQITSGRVDPNGVEVGTARAIARAGDVRLRFLLTGQPPREPYEGDGPEAASDDDLPERAGVIAAGRIQATALGVDPSDVDATVAMFRSIRYATPPGHDQLAEDFAKTLQQVLRLRKRLHDVVDETDHDAEILDSKPKV